MFEILELCVCLKTSDSESNGQNVYFNFVIMFTFQVDKMLRFLQFNTPFGC